MHKKILNIEYTNPPNSKSVGEKINFNFLEIVTKLARDLKSNPRDPRDCNKCLKFPVTEILNTRDRH